MSGIDLEGMTPAARAKVIYTQAKADVSNKLWDAALGGVEDDEKNANPLQPFGKQPSLEGLFNSMKPTAGGQGFLHRPHLPVPGACSPEQTAVTSIAAPANPAPSTSDADLGGLGANTTHAGALGRAAARSGIPAPALAAIVDAEAAKRPDGSWNPHSRNPRSSAAGLGQFLSGTWMEMAEKPGTWLNEKAQASGWLNSRGDVSRAHRGAVLALRYDPEASINTTADYARGNIDHLRRSGVRLGDTPSDFARAAYLGHHLGPGDAVRFLKGGLSQSRAATLLKAQIGSGKAENRIQSVGCAATAHRQWLNSYVASNIRPDKFTESRFT